MVNENEIWNFHGLIIKTKRLVEDERWGRTWDVEVLDGKWTFGDGDNLLESTICNLFTKIL